MTNNDKKDWNHSYNTDKWLINRLNLCEKPVGDEGKELALQMNAGHRELVDWGLDTFLDRLEAEAKVLDIGCGGGATLKNLRDRLPESALHGIDYSADMASMARGELAGTAEIIHGDVADLPYPDDTFALITAVETVFFWPDLLSSFQNVYHSLKEHGSFIIINEIYDDHENPAFKERNERIIRLSNLKLFTPEYLESALLKAGFKRVDYKTVSDNNWITYRAIK